MLASTAPVPSSQHPRAFMDHSAERRLNAQVVLRHAASRAWRSAAGFIT